MIRSARPTLAEVPLADLSFDNHSATLRDDVFSAYHGNQIGLYSQHMVERMEQCRDPLLNQWTRASIERG
jgi:hypothetical protein